MSAQILTSILTSVVMLPVLLGAVSYLILLERKIASWSQDRTGPNRVGPMGLFQPIADGIKLFVKEDYTPPFVDKALFYLAPALGVIPGLIGWAVMPWGGYLQWGDQILWVTAAPINIGVIYVLAVGSLAVYGVVLGGYASNSKFSFFGGLRATAQMLSYEIPMGLALLVLVLMTGSLRADLLVQSQANGVWNIFYQPLLAIIFFTCSLAEANRAPFDLAEAEQELVGGYHTEYSSMKFALFFLGEYLHMITACSFFTLLFLGGWDLPFWQEPAVGGLALVFIKATVFFAKAGLLLAFMMWIRWTLPRFRFDQLMRLAWRSLIPASLLLLLCTSMVVFFRWPHWALIGGNVLLALIGLTVGQDLPQGPPVNRRVPLSGSRFCPPAPAAESGHEGA